MILEDVQLPCLISRGYVATILTNLGTRPRLSSSVKLWTGLQCGLQFTLLGHRLGTRSLAQQVFQGAYGARVKTVCPMNTRRCGNVK